MTEPFPFGVQDEAPVAYEEETAKDRKPLLVLGAVAAVALGAGAFFMLSGGDAAEDEFSLPARTARPAATKPATKPAVTLPAKSTVQLGRNPFKALYVQPAASTGGTSTAPTGTTGTTTGTTPTSTGTGTGTTVPIVVVDGGSSPTKPTSPSGGSTPPPSGTDAPARSTVKLSGVSTKSGKPVGTFVLDGKELSGKAGDVLGGKLLVISLQQDATGGWFANLQVGDGSPFEVHQRQEVVVQ